MSAKPTGMKAPWLALVLTVACGGATTQSPPVTAPPSVSSAQTQKAAPPKPIDPARVESATGAKAESAEGVVKVSFPRTDVPVEIDGIPNVPPFMGLTSWAGFAPGEKPGVEAMVMGDVVLFEDEVTPAMRAALDGGLEVTALHNHFFFDKP